MSSQQLTELIIGCVFKVSNTLGAGFLEKVYENALAFEMRRCGLNVLQQHPITVFYEGAVVGDYHADLFINGSVIVELKAVKELTDTHVAQCLNYLKATGVRVCLLVNFAKPKVEIRRLVR
jgi:GxxExxY protein